MPNKVDNSSLVSLGLRSSQVLSLLTGGGKFGEAQIYFPRRNIEIAQYKRWCIWRENENTFPSLPGRKSLIRFVQFYSA